MWRRIALLFLFPVVLLGIARAPDLSALTSQEVYLSCSSERVATFGWTHKTRPQAEIAAILRWKEESARNGNGITEWHHARKRHLSCRRIGGKTGQFQCRIAATPCKPAKA